MNAIDSANLFEGLGERWLGLRHEDMDATTRQVAGQCLLDWLGCTIAGAREPLARILQDTYADRAGPARIVGTPLRLAADTAALVNGAAGHALDFDDTFHQMGGHLSVPLAPAVLAVAEETGASGADVIGAFVAGAEVAGRMGVAMGEGHYLRGWHQTATVGVFAATTAAARLMGLDSQQYVHAMAIACSQASGVKANFGTMTKPLHAGMAAEHGVVAARLASRGFTANPEAFAGNQGLVQASCSGPAQLERVEKLADAWMLPKILFKFHAACHLTHSTIEGITGLKSEIAGREPDAVELTVHPSILDVCGIPEPRTGLEGKFSLRGTAALTLLDLDTASAATFVDDVIASDEVQRLITRVRVRTDESLTSMQARVRIETGGAALENAHDTAQFTTDFDAQGDKLAIKFASLAAPVLGERVQDVVAELSALENADSLDSLLEAVVA